MKVLTIFSRVLILGIFTQFASARSGISLTQEDTIQTYTIEHEVTLALDELIKITIKGRLIDGEVEVFAPNGLDGSGGYSPVSILYMSKVFDVTDASLTGDISVRNWVTVDRSLLARFLTEDQWPLETDNSTAYSSPTIEYTNGAEYASESWTNGNPNTIWYRNESVTKRHRRLYLTYIGEQYAAWFQLGFVIQPRNSMVFSVEDHEIVPVENRKIMRLPSLSQISDEENDIGINLKSVSTVEGIAHKQGTYVVLSSADLKNWSWVSSFSLNHPGSIEFSVSLPTQNTYEVWEIPSEGNTSHPNYDEESDVIWLDEPILESTPIRSRFFKIEYQAPE